MLWLTAIATVVLQVLRTLQGPIIVFLTMLCLIVFCKTENEHWPVKWVTMIISLYLHLTLVLIEPALDGVCCVWFCIAADQSGYPCWPLPTTISTNNGYVSIRTGAMREGGLDGWVFVGIGYLGNTWDQDDLWKAMFCWETSSPPGGC